MNAVREHATSNKERNGSGLTLRIAFIRINSVWSIHNGMKHPNLLA